MVYQLTAAAAGAISDADFYALHSRECGKYEYYNHHHCRRIGVCKVRCQFMGVQQMTSRGNHAMPGTTRLRATRPRFAMDGTDVFVHITAVERAGLSTLSEGQMVEFDIVQNKGKSSAENLKPIGG